MTILSASSHPLMKFIQQPPSSPTSAAHQQMQLQVKAMTNTSIQFMAGNQRLDVPRTQVQGQLHAGVNYRPEVVSSTTNQVRLVPLTPPNSAPPQTMSDGLARQVAPRALALSAVQDSSPIVLRAQVQAHNARTLSLALDSGQSLQLPANTVTPRLAPGTPLTIEVKPLPKGEWQLSLSAAQNKTLTLPADAKHNAQLLPLQGGQSVPAEIVKGADNSRMLALANGTRIAIPNDSALVSNGSKVWLQARSNQGQWQLTLQPQQPQQLAQLTVSKAHISALSGPLLSQRDAVSINSNQLTQWQQGLMVKGHKTELANITNQLNQQPAQLHVNQKGQMRLAPTSAQTVTVTLNNGSGLSAIKAAPVPQGEPRTLNITSVQPKGEVNLSAHALSLSPRAAFPSQPPSPLLQHASALTADNKATIQQWVTQLTQQQSSPAQNMSQLLGLMQRMEGDLQHSGKDLSATLQAAKSQIAAATPSGANNDAQLIRQLLTSSTISTINQIAAPATGSGMVGGLVTLLQVALGARLNRHNQAHAGKWAEALTSKLPTEGGKTAAQGQLLRQFADLAQADSRQQLLRQAGQLLSQHQLSKASSADAAIQGQEHIHLNLPIGDKPARDAELLIRRDDQGNAHQDGDGKMGKSWNLTMKLDIGALGGLLTKAKLRSTSLELDLYTENDALKLQVERWLPTLTKRLSALGLEVTKAQCQKGKIPERLHQSSYHLVEAQA